MANKFKDILNRILKSPSGVTAGLKVAIGTVGLGYAATQSVYTGM